MAQRTHTPEDPDYASRVRDSFGRQRAMALIGARLSRVAPGLVEVELDFDPRLTQQHGFLHAGVVGMALDSACGYAASTLMPAAAGVLTVEYKLNLLAPARGRRFLMTGRVRKAGRTLIVCEGEALAFEAPAPPEAGESGGQLAARQAAAGRLVASMTATLMTIRGRDDVRG